MLLGKRPRPHIRRTTSMTTFPPNVEMSDSYSPDNQDQQQNHDHRDKQTLITNDTTNDNSSNYYHDHGRFLASMVLSPRNVQQHQRSSSSGGLVSEPSNFLRTCGLCGRRLSFGRDIYMYRGDTAFCSQECREKRMEQDERNDKYNEATK